MRVCAVAVLAALLGCGGGAPSEPVGVVAEPDFAASCRECHEHADRALPWHDHACGTCHVESTAGPTGDQPAGHAVAVANPSDPSVWQTTCGSCHPEALQRMQRSLHWTQAGVINHTRYLWGAQDRVAPAMITLAEFAAQDSPPFTADRAHEPADLVDDLLRRRCLRCHLLAEGAGEGGRSRASGCAACHDAGDGHGLVRPRSSTPCLACHQGDATGIDYHGAFQIDDHRDFRVPTTDGLDGLRPWPRAHHLLQQDLHQQAGLSCVHCHDIDEVMGRLDGDAPSLASEAVDVRCASCHGDLDGRRTAEPPPSLSCEGDACTVEVVQRATVTLSVPRAADSVAVAHDTGTHDRLTCTACHASWAGQVFGYHLHRSMVPTWNLWEPRAAQGDPEIEQRVAEAMALSDDERAALAPAMTDRLTGEEQPGLWAGGRTLRRWEEPPLGVTANGRIAPLRPRHGYVVTSVGADGLVWLDSVVPQRGDGSGPGQASEPFTPHTAQRAGASCERCHGNPRAAGRGIAVATDTEPLHADTVPLPPATPGARLLTPQEQARLLEPSAAQRAAFARHLCALGVEEWLP